MDRLWRGLAEALSAIGYQPKLIVFQDRAFEVSTVERIPEANGGTELAGAIQLARAHELRHTLIFSDGAPDSEEQSYAEHRKLSGDISVHYCGDDVDSHAYAFLQSLVRGSGKMSQGSDKASIAQAVSAFDPAKEVELVLGRAGCRSSAFCLPDIWSATRHARMGACRRLFAGRAGLGDFDAPPPAVAEASKPAAPITRS